MSFMPPSFPEKPDFSPCLASLSPEQQAQFEAMQKAFRQAMDTAAQIRGSHLSLTAEALKKLPDEELYSAVRDRLDVRFSQEGTIDLSGLPPEQMALYVVDQLDCEVNNGGLCQFFANAGYLLPLVSASLEEIGAAEHKALFDGFVSRCRIDLRDPSAFRLQRAEDYAALLSRYPWQEFDDAYFSLPLLHILGRYIRENIQHF